MEIHLESQEELNCNLKTKIMAKVCQLFVLFHNSKMILQLLCESKMDHKW